MQHAQYGKWRRARIAASAGILLAGVWGASAALFTDTASSDAGDFTTGTVAISATDAATAGLALEGMAPGDSVVAPVTVSNEGSLDLRYAMATATTGDAALAAALVVDVKAGVTACDADGFNADGTAVATGTLSAVAFGDLATGADAGDRNLAAGAAEDLCFRVSLPADADGSVQGLTTAATFTFAAEQVHNNP